MSMLNFQQTLQNTITQKNGYKSWYDDNMIVFIFLSLEIKGPVHCNTFCNHTGQSVKDLNIA